MRSTLRLCLAAAVLLSASAAVAARMPTQIELAGQTLQLNGKATQRVFLFSIYEVGLYLAAPTKSEQEAISSDQMKRIHLHLLRDASREQLAQAIRKGFRNSNPPEVLPKLERRLRALLEALPDPSAGDDLYITYVPGDGTYLAAKGRKGGLKIPGKDFADALFSVWLGRDPGVAHLKNQLLSPE